MDWLSERELKIFLTVFLVLGLFVQWYGVNANSRVDLTRSIVEKGELNINEYRNNTGDRAYFQGDYYSDKAPGLSMMGAPIYGSWKALYSIFGDSSIKKDGPEIMLGEVGKDIHLSDIKKPGSFYLSSLILLILFTSTLSLAVLSILIYRITEDILDKEWKRLALTFGFAFGTPVTHYGIAFLPVATATLLGFSSFYILMNEEEYPGSRKMVLAGFLGGLAVIFKSIMVVVLVFNALYAFAKYRQIPYFYTLGGFLGGLPYMIYNTIAFGAPWNLPRNFLDPLIWPHLQDKSGFILDPVRNFFVTLRLWFFPYRGIFYWFPMLLLSIIGFKRFRREKMLESATVLSIFLGITLLVSSWWAWWHGGFFGARLMAPLTPFLIIPALYASRKINPRILVSIIAVSVMVNAAGFQGTYEDALKDVDSSSEMIDEAEGKVKSLEVLGNPLTNHYFPGLLENGPQSRMINGIYNGDIPPDIRTYNSYENKAPTFLVIILILTTTGTIWNRELYSKLEEHRRRVIEFEGDDTGGR